MKASRVKSRCSLSRPAWPSCARNPGDAARRAMAADMPSTEPGLHRMPLTPSSTISHTPPWLKATMALPAAIASSTTVGKGSGSVDGSTKMSMSASTLPTSLRKSCNTTRPSSPCCTMDASSASRTRLSPSKVPPTIRKRRLASAGSNRAAQSSKAPCPFHQLMRPTMPTTQCDASHPHSLRSTPRCPSNARAVSMPLWMTTALARTRGLSAHKWSRVAAETNTARCDSRPTHCAISRANQRGRVVISCTCQTCGTPASRAASAPASTAVVLLCTMARPCSRTSRRM